MKHNAVTPCSKSAISPRENNWDFVAYVFGVVKQLLQSVCNFEITSRVLWLKN